MIETFLFDFVCGELYSNRSRSFFLYLGLTSIVTLHNFHILHKKGIDFLILM